MRSATATLLTILCASVAAKQAHADHGVFAESCRVQLAVTETADCRLTVERTPDEAKPVHVVKAVQLAGVQNAQVVSEPGGVYSVVYDFSQANDLGGLADAENAFLDKESGALVFRPNRTKKFGIGAYAGFPRRFKLPCTITVDVTSIGKDAVVAMPVALSQGTVVASISSADSFKASTKLELKWYPKAAEPEMLLARTFGLEVKGEVQCRLPLPSDPILEPASLNFLVRGNSSAAVRTWSVKAPIVPSFGLELAASNQAVFVKRVAKNSAAGRSGLAPGDVILSIGTAKPSTSADASLRLSDVAIGEKAELKIRRAGKEINVMLIAD